MKNLLLLLFVMQQCVAVNNIKTLADVTKTLNNSFMLIKNKEMSDVNIGIYSKFALELDQDIVEITNEAIKKSKDILGKQDVVLVQAAKVLRNISNDIIKMYMEIPRKITILKNDRQVRDGYLSHIGAILGRMKNEEIKIAKSYITISKKEAQKYLEEIIKFFKRLLSDLEQEIDLLDPMHFA